MVKVMSRDGWSFVGGGCGILGGGERWLLMQSLMEDVDGKKDLEVAWVEGVLEGALGALGDEHGFFWRWSSIVLLSEVNEQLFWRDYDKLLSLAIC